MRDADQQLLEHWIVRRDAHAFREIVACHSGMVYATCLRILGNSAEAEELAQDSFEALARAKQAPGAYLGAWLHRVATNLCLKRIRSETRRCEREQRFAGERPPHVEAAWDDIQGYVDEAVAALPEKFRMALVAHFIEGASLAAIAKELGVSPRTVAYRIDRGVTLVRNTLKRRGIAVGTVAFVAMLGANLADAAAPATLTAVLGKLAIAGGAGPTSMGASTVVNTLGGLLIMKKAVLGLVVTIGILLAFWAVRQVPEPGPPDTRDAKSTTLATDKSSRSSADLQRSDESEMPRDDSAVVPRSDDTDRPEQLSVAPAGLDAVVGDHSPKGNAKRGVDPALQERGTLEGVVMVAGEVAVNLALTTQHYLAAGTPSTIAITTDEKGFYRMAGLPEGGRTVHFLYQKAGGGTMLNYKVPVIIEAGETTVADVNFDGGGASIEGVVYQDDETPLVANIEAHFGTRNYYVETNVDGYYRIENLPEGSVQILAYLGSKDGDAPIRRRVVNLEVGESDEVVQDFWFSSLEVACTVSSVPAGAFIAFFVAYHGEVDLSKFSLENASLLTQQRAALAQVEPNSTGSITDLEPGIYTIAVISFPSDPSAFEALEGQALVDFVEGIQISSTEIVVVEESEEALQVNLFF